MSITTSLAKSLSASLGPAEESIYTAVPPLHLGGGADVLEFRRAASVGGVVYVSAGACAERRPEIALATRTPEPWAAPLVSRVAAAGRDRPSARGGTLALGDGPVAGLAFWELGVAARQIEGRWVAFLLAVGLTARELAACQTHGVEHVVRLLREAGVFPFTDAGRGDLAALGSLGPSATDRQGLSPRAADGLYAAVHRQDERVELLRGPFPASDLEQFAASYERLGSLGQRAALVQLVQDNKGPAVSAIYRAFVRDAAGAAILAQQGHEHASLAASLSALEDDFSRFNHWFRSVEAAQARAREIAG